MSGSGELSTAIGLDTGSRAGAPARTGSLAVADAEVAAASMLFASGVGVSAIFVAEPSACFIVGTGAAFGTVARGALAPAAPMPGFAPAFGSIARASGRFGSSGARAPFDAAVAAGFAPSDAAGRDVAS